MDYHPDTGVLWAGGLFFNGGGPSFITTIDPVAGTVSALIPSVADLDAIAFVTTDLVGGEYFTLDQTALLVSGVQTNLAWIIPVISAAVISAVVLRKKF